ncbi:hypothetical protein L1049_026182 [Liquidambar formosana]|uniref:Uncharacterized protein n=1 Tax=Liquidambar formosana TaxID=63359 RepID=A0AAP0R673_LIQFO
MRLLLFHPLPPFNSIPPSSQIVSPPPGGHHTTIIAVCVSLGGVFFLAFLALGLFCLAKKKKKPIMVPAAVCIEEHEQIRETITTGPCGEQTMVVSIEDDVQIHEVLGGTTVAAGSHIGAVSSPPCSPPPVEPCTTHAPGYHQHG